MKPRDYEKEFEAIMDALAESINDSTDEEIIEEYNELNEDPTEAANKVRSVLFTAANSLQRRNLEAARKKYELSVREIKNNIVSLPPSIEERRTLLDLAFSRNPAFKQLITAQYRDFRGLTDSDIENLLQQLKALGALEDSKEK